MSETKLKIKNLNFSNSFILLRVLTEPSDLTDGKSLTSPSVYTHAPLDSLIGDDADKFVCVVQNIQFGISDASASTLLGSPPFFFQILIKNADDLMLGIIIL